MTRWRLSKGFFLCGFVLLFSCTTPPSAPRESTEEPQHTEGSAGEEPQRLESSQEGGSPEPHESSPPEATPEPSFPPPEAKPDLPEGATPCDTHVSPAGVCPKDSFCSAGRCQPLPTPVWALRSYQGLNLLGGGHSFEVDGQGYIYLLTDYIHSARFGSFQTPLPSGSQTSRYLVRVSPQGEWLGFHVLQQHDPDVSDFPYMGSIRLVRSKEGAVELVAQANLKLPSDLPAKGEGSLVRVRLSPQQGFVSAHYLPLGGGGGPTNVSFSAKGHLYVAGSHSWPLLAGTPHALVPPSSDGGGFVVKYDLQGQPLWARSLLSGAVYTVFQLDEQGGLWFHGSYRDYLKLGETWLANSKGQGSFWARMDENGTWLSAQTFPRGHRIHVTPSPHGLPVVLGSLKDFNDPLFSSFDPNKGDFFIGQLTKEGRWAWVHQTLMATDFGSSQDVGGSLFAPNHTLVFGLSIREWGDPLRWPGWFSFSPPSPSPSDSGAKLLVALDAQGQWRSWGAPFGCFHLEFCGVRIHQLRAYDGFLYQMGTFDGDLAIGSLRLPKKDTDLSAGENFFLVKWPLP